MHYDDKYCLLSLTIVALIWGWCVLSGEQMTLYVCLQSCICYSYFAMMIVSIYQLTETTLGAVVMARLSHIREKQNFLQVREL